MSLPNPTPDVTKASELIPGRVRLAIYAGYVFLVVLAGALGEWFVTDPEWLDASSRVLAYLGIPVASLAAVNVDRSNGL